MVNVCCEQFHSCSVISFFFHLQFQFFFISNNYEVTTIKAREQAERCQLDRVEQYAVQCADLHKSMLGNMSELQKGINCALVEIEKFEGENTGVCVSFCVYVYVGLYLTFSCCCKDKCIIYLRPSSRHLTTNVLSLSRCR